MPRIVEIRTDERFEKCPGFILREHERCKLYSQLTRAMTLIYRRERELSRARDIAHSATLDVSIPLDIFMPSFAIIKM